MRGWENHKYVNGYANSVDTVHLFTRPNRCHPLISQALELCSSEAYLSQFP